MWCMTDCLPGFDISTLSRRFGVSVGRYSLDLFTLTTQRHVPKDRPPLSHRCASHMFITPRARWLSHLFRIQLAWNPVHLPRRSFTLSCTCAYLSTDPSGMPDIEAQLFFSFFLCFGRRRHFLCLTLVSMGEVSHCQHFCA